MRACVNRTFGTFYIKNTEDPIQMTDRRPLSIGHSPDADDAFMFYALAHEHITIPGREIQHVMEDIESLNNRAEAECPRCSLQYDVEIPETYRSYPMFLRWK